MSDELPSFLHFSGRDPCLGSYSASGVFKHAVFSHPASAHVRWWPPENSQPQIVVLFIPGNPGLIDFYDGFLTSLSRTYRARGLAILAHAHLGHSPHLDFPYSSSLRLLDQVEARVEVVDKLREAWPTSRIILIGHSVGSWISLEVLKARPDHITGCFLLFPTISRISQTPNGRMLFWLFNPAVSWTVSALSVVIRPVVAVLLSLLYSSWPLHQRAVLETLIRSPKTIRACLSMARDEMQTIKEPDSKFLTENSAKLWFYYAKVDGWVGKERDANVGLLGEDATVRVVHCKHDVPHAFCILHGDLIAEQCALWLKDGGVIG